MVATQLTVLVERSNDDDIVGNAILTIVPSRDDIKAASEIEKINRVKPDVFVLIPGFSIYQIGCLNKKTVAPNRDTEV
jgi:hypothetical protein